MALNDEGWTLRKASHDVALEAWDSWQNWMYGDPIAPRLELAVNAVCDLWEERLRRAEKLDVEVNFVDGPLAGLSRFQSHVDAVVMVRTPDQPLHERTKHIYQWSSARNHYQYLGEI